MQIMTQSGQHLDKYNFIYVAKSPQSGVITLQAPAGFDKTATSKLHVHTTSSLELYVPPFRTCCTAMPSLIVLSRTYVCVQVIIYVDL